LRETAPADDAPPPTSIAAAARIGR
jgi:hypothetical protein